MRKDVPQAGKMPAWRRGKHSIAIGLTTEMLEQEARGNIDVQSSKVNHWSFGEYYCAVCGLLTCTSVEAMELENKDLKASTISVAASPLSKNVCGTMGSRKSSTEAAF